MDTMISKDGKTGWWEESTVFRDSRALGKLVTCTVCGYTTEPHDLPWHYCPRCGARMT